MMAIDMSDDVFFWVLGGRFPAFGAIVPEDVVLKGVLNLKRWVLQETVFYCSLLW